MEDLNKKAHIFGSIFMLANRLQVLGDKFDRNITIKQWMLLAGIYKLTDIHGKESSLPTISEAANFIGYSRQNVKKMALILERQEFLNLRKDLADARILRISLTEKCLKYFKNREQRETEFLERLFEDIDYSLIECMEAGVSKLEENIIKMEKEYNRDGEYY